MRLKFGDSFNVPTLDDTSQMSITIDGTSVTWLRQDDNDPPAFYFLPPPHTSGTVDVVISGISIPNMPFLGANPPLPLKLTQFLVYTDDSTKGIKGFSDSIGVSIDEAESRAESNQNDNGLSAQDTADYFSELLDNQSNYGMDLMKIFMNGKSLDTSSGDPLQQMESTNDAKYQTALNDLGYSANGSGGGGGGPSPALALAPNSSGRIATGSTASNAAVVNLSTLTVETSGGQTGFVFMRWGNFNNPLTINFTIAGSASNGTDYSTIGSSVTIPANQASATVPIQSVAGATGKTVQITISASQSYQMGSAGSAQLSLP